MRPLDAIKAGYDELAVFEINKSYNKDHADDDNGLPTEFDMLAFVLSAADKKSKLKSGAAFYEARAYLDFVAHALGIELEYLPVVKETDFPVVQPFDLKRSALVQVKGTDVVLGIVGEYRPAVRKGFKLPGFTAGFEIGIKELLATAKPHLAYEQLPRFPKLTQDMTLRVPAATNYQALYNVVNEQLAVHRPDETYHRLLPVGIYQDAVTPEYKNVTFRLNIASYERTLVDAEVNALLDNAAAVASKELKAERV
jgi:phenylalanyl-tRNA synthetase beta subunit